MYEVGLTSNNAFFNLRFQDTCWTLTYQCSDIINLPISFEISLKGNELENEKGVNISNIFLSNLEY